MRSARTSLLAAGVAAAAFVAPSSAVTIYGINNLGESQFGPGGDQLIRFDSSNPLGTVVNIGRTGVATSGFSGLDFHSNGNLYGAVGFVGTGGNTANINNFYQLDINTGTATLIGNMGLPAGFSVADLSFNPATGQMQALVNNATAGAGRIVRLYTVNVATGAATLVGDITGLPISPATDKLLVGLATAADGTNYVHDLVADRMFRLNGLAAQPLGSGTLGFNTNFSQGMTIDHAGDGTWYLASLEVTAGGALDGSRIRTVSFVDGSANTILATWPTGPGNTALPRYELGDIAAVIPEPAAVMLLAPLALLRRRRG
ncbi:MAG: DUF4394 domain-containing protein [Phycisphaerae bacterium]|nr:DUF4394 domain-containing protein [Phycisphaerae bacterium]MDW8262213.1 hypothetical protein [Phycisphaerales bacterium]